MSIYGWPVGAIVSIIYAIRNERSFINPNSLRRKLDILFPFIFSLVKMTFIQNVKFRFTEWWIGVDGWLMDARFTTWLSPKFGNNSL